MNISKYLPNINAIRNTLLKIEIKYYIYILFMILLFIYIIYLFIQEEKYDIILPRQYLFINAKKKYNDADIFFTMDNYNDDLPAKIDLRSKCPPVYYQGKLGLCHINATCFAYRYICLNNNIDFNPSRMFCEYNILHLRGNLNKINIKNRVYQFGSQGTQDVLEDINSLLLYGACEEKDYPYPSKEETEYNTNIIEEIDILKNNIYSEKDLINISNKYKEIQLTPPTKQMYINAQNHKILDVYNLAHDIIEIKKYLNRYGPVLFSFTHSDWITGLFSIQYNTEIFKQVKNNENLNNSDKDILNNLINAYTKFINDNDNTQHFNSYYDDMNNIKLSDNLLNLVNKYVSEHDREHDSFSREVYSKATMKDLTLKFPTDLIKESEEYLLENGINLEDIKNNLKKFRENNLPEEYLNSYRSFSLDKIQKTLNRTKKGKDIYDFITKNHPTSGHIMTIVGYDDKEQVFIIANSWGTEWGDNGYFYMDYEYFNNKDYFWGEKTGMLFCIHNTKDGNIY